MNKITYEDVLENIKNSDNKRSNFKHYCYLNSSCDRCSRRIRIICKIKSKLTKIQDYIITKL